jgi:DNA replication protein DnaC
MIAKNLVQKALDQGYKGRFITAAKLIADLLSADYRLESRLRYYTNLDILAIDEIGYLSFESRAADLLFEVVSRRYEQAPIILTTNLAFKDWPSIFPGAFCVSALVDRLIHHCHILPIRGDSYRQKESKDKKDLS